MTPRVIGSRHRFPFPTLYTLRERETGNADFAPAEDRALRGRNLSAVWSLHTAETGWAIFTRRSPSLTLCWSSANAINPFPHSARKQLHQLSRALSICGRIKLTRP